MKLKEVYRAFNESMWEDIVLSAKKAKCGVKSEDHLTKITVTGTKKQLEKFHKVYESQGL